MQEYQRLGVGLGLLIHPQSQQVEIYRPEQKVELLDCPSAIDCAAVMPGFVLNLRRVATGLGIAELRSSAKCQIEQG